MELRKFVLRMPRRRAYSFINSAKAASVPAVYSARATEASLPDWMIMPRISWSTRTRVPTSMNMREPPVRQARSLTVTMSSSAISPLRSSLNTA